jgi:hypothetical protein
MPSVRDEHARLAPARLALGLPPVPSHKGLGSEGWLTWVLHVLRVALSAADNRRVSRWAPSRCMLPNMHKSRRHPTKGRSSSRLLLFPWRRQTGRGCIAPMQNHIEASRQAKNRRFQEPGPAKGLGLCSCRYWQPLSSMSLIALLFSPASKERLQAAARPSL